MKYFILVLMLNNFKKIVNCNLIIILRLGCFKYIHNNSILFIITPPSMKNKDFIGKLRRIYDIKM